MVEDCHSISYLTLAIADHQISQGLPLMTDIEDFELLNWSVQYEMSAKPVDELATDIAGLGNNKQSTRPVIAMGTHLVGCLGDRTGMLSLAANVKSSEILPTDQMYCERHQFLSLYHHS